MEHHGERYPYAVPHPDETISKEPGNERDLAVQEVVEVQALRNWVLDWVNQGRGTPSSIAAAIGVNPNWVYRLLKWREGGKTRSEWPPQSVSFARLRRALEHMGVPLADLLAFVAVSGGTALQRPQLPLSEFEADFLRALRQLSPPEAAGFLQQLRGWLDRRPKLSDSVCPRCRSRLTPAVANRFSGLCADCNSPFGSALATPSARTRFTKPEFEAAKVAAIKRGGKDHGQ